MRFALFLTLTLTFALAGGAHAAGTDRLKSFMTDTQSARGEFTQRIFDRNGKLTQESRGTIAFARPGKFRWTYEKPYQQIIVGDGTRVWIFDSDLNQVTVKKLGAALGSTPAALLAGDNDAMKAFALTDEGAREGLEWVQAVPRQKDTSFERIRLGFSAAGLEAMDLFDSFGQRTQLRFSRLARNPAIEAATFTFTPPAGADVINQ